MFSLPDIVRMNQRAADNRLNLKREANRKRKPKCNCGKRSVDSHLYYDIFSANPKGVVHVCEDCYPEDDSLRFCPHCDRLMVTNYTWERYFHEGICLDCAAREYFEDKGNMLAPSEVKEWIVSHDKNVPFFRNGMLNLSKAKHVLAVKQPLPKGIRFVDNVEFDMTNGQQISGDNPIEIIKKIGRPFFCVCDATYQFALSIGFYVEEN